jgi:hypothetical protein
MQRKRCVDLSEIPISIIYHVSLRSHWFIWEPALGRYLEEVEILQIMESQAAMLNLPEIFVDGDEAFA